MKRKKDNQWWANRIVEYGQRPANQFLAHELNARRHPAKQREALRGSLDSVGWIAPTVVSARTGKLLDGHARIEEALSVDETMAIPFVEIDVSEAEEKLILAAFDPITGLATYDKDALSALLKEVQSDDARINDMLAELAGSVGLLLDEKTPGAGGDEYDTTPDEQQTRVEYGDLWACGEHRVLCGDSTKAEDVGRVMNGEKADCVFTSPPYAVGLDYGDTYEDSIENLRAMLPTLSKRWLDAVTDGGFAVVNFGDIASGRNIADSETPCEYPMAVEYWPVFRADGWSLWSRRVWCKPNARVNSLWCIQSNRAATDWEHVWTWKKPGAAIVDRVEGDYRSALGWIDTTSMHGVDVGKETHGAGMALAIVEWMLTVHSRKGRIVYEPFGGTGTTLIGAVRTRRICMAMEINPSYVNVILSRYEAETGNAAQLLERRSLAQTG